MTHFMFVIFLEKFKELVSECGKFMRYAHQQRRNG